MYFILKHDRYLIHEGNNRVLMVNVKLKGDDNDS